MDNPFVIETNGQADWDAALTANFAVLERGYHMTERAGTAINTGQVLWLNSGGFFMPFDPNSLAIYPHAMAYTAAASGDSMSALAWGIVRSLGINSPAVPGGPLYVSATTPGVIVSSFAGATRQIGWGLSGNGVLFQPSKTKWPTNIRSLSGISFTGLANDMIIKWSDASSQFVMAVDSAGGGGGGTTLAALTDVDTTGIANGKALVWSDASSKWHPATISGGGTSVGSPPAVVQAAIALGSNAVTFVTSPASGNYLVGMTWNPLSDVLAAGWTFLNKSTSGTDFAVMGGKPLAAPATLVQTFDASSSATMLTMMVELHGGKGVTPQYIAANVGNSVGGTAPGLPSFPNIVDMISIHGVGFVSAASSLTAIYNVNSALFSNSGTVRQGAVGWSWFDHPLAQMLATLTASAETKGMVGLFTS